MTRKAYIFKCYGDLCGDPVPHWVLLYYGEHHVRSTWRACLNLFWLMFTGAETPQS